MGTITERKRKDGSTAYMARVRVTLQGKPYHETETFDRRSNAAAWLARRENELAKPGAVPAAADPTLADAITKYTTDSRKQIGKTKAQVLATIAAEHDIAAMRCSTIKSHDILAFAQSLGKKVQPQTVGNYMSHLAAVFAIARPAWGYPLDAQAMADAAAVAKRLGVTSKSKERTRRPTVAEIECLLAHFAKVRARRPSTNPMHDIVLFALASTRRQEEITRITWGDFDEQRSRVIVRDMKHPGDKIGNDQPVNLPPEAMAIALRQPRKAAAIFPYSTDAIGAAFTRACKLLGIVDLHFHDLRHDGISRLFEMGWTIPQVATVSGHRNWQSLQRYTHIEQTGADKWHKLFAAVL